MALHAKVYIGVTIAIIGPEVIQAHCCMFSVDIDTQISQKISFIISFSIICHEMIQLHIANVITLMHSWVVSGLCNPCK